MSRFDNIFERARYIDIQDTVKHLLPHGKKQGNEWIALNPARSDGRLGSFKVNLRTGKWADFATEHRGRGVISLYAYLKNISAYRSAQELLGEYRSYYANDSSECNNDNESKNESKLNYIHKILSECRDPKGTLVEKYLFNRCITAVLPESISYHPSLYHALTKSHYPAMVSKVVKYQSIIGIHRTYLSSDGTSKANIEPNKMMLGSMKGGGVYLKDDSTDTSNIIIAEGIETALSLYQATSKYVIASLSASNMPNVVLPSSSVNSITIAIDNDEAGIEAGANTVFSLSILGYKNIKTIKPDCVNDFNDLLRG